MPIGLPGYQLGVPRPGPFSRVKAFALRVRRDHQLAAGRAQLPASHTARKESTIRHLSPAWFFAYLYAPFLAAWVVLTIATQLF